MIIRDSVSNKRKSDGSFEGDLLGWLSRHGRSNGLSPNATTQNDVCESATAVYNHCA